MSWNDWCDNIRAAGFVSGGIYGDDGAPWAEFCEDANLKFSGGEIPNILKYIKLGMAGAAGTSVHVNKTKQMILRAEDGELTGKCKADSSIVAVKCNQCIVVGVGGKGSEPRKMLLPLASLGDNLKSSGY